jgi:hypothetical protein
MDARPSLCRVSSNRVQCTSVGQALTSTKHETEAEGIKQATIDWHCNVTSK